MVPALMGFLFVWHKPTVTTLQHLWCVVSQWSQSHPGGACGFHPLPSQPVQPHGAKGGAMSLASTSLWVNPACCPEAAGDKLWLPLEKSVSQRWNSFLLQLLEENVNCSCCFCYSTSCGEAQQIQGRGLLPSLVEPRAAVDVSSSGLQHPPTPLGLVKWIWGGNQGLRAASLLVSCWACLAAERISTWIPTQIAKIILCGMWKYKPSFSRLLKPPALVPSCFLLLAH